MRAVMLLALVAGCGAPALTIANGVGLGAQSAALACDWGQTRAAASNGWQRQWEENPIMGRKPSTSTVDMYFIGALGLSLAAWKLSPRRWRMAVPLVVLALEARSIGINLGARNHDLGACGLR